MGELRTREDVHDLIAGLTLLGTGGGGRPEQGLEALLPHVEAGRRVAWVPVESVPDDGGACSVFDMGSIAPGGPPPARGGGGVAGPGAPGPPVVDGDCAGRAIPELSQTTAAIAGIRFAPGAIADPWGNVLLVKETASDLVTERIGKLVSMATKLPDLRAPCAHAGFLMRGRDLKAITVQGGISRALAVGRALRQAPARRRGPAGGP